jgi:pSer/pThr/pTyr-binding forkhead associated (FHA) protein
LGFVENFERRLESFVNGAFSKAFKSQLQPVEISAAIKAKMDVSAAVIGKDRILAPNEFRVSLSQPDLLRLNSLGDNLVAEITKQVSAHVKKQRYQLTDELKISLSSSSTLAVGQIQVAASGSKAAQVANVTWVPALDISGKRYLLAKEKTTVGRDAVADIQVNDSGLSRTHFAINWDGANATVEDLGSTNGTTVAGQDVKLQNISADTIIKAGRTEFVFRVVAKNQGDA